MKQEENIGNEVKTLREFTYVGDTVSGSGGCEASVTARTKFGLVWLPEYGELLCGRRFPGWMKGVAYKSTVWPAILYGS